MATVFQDGFESGDLSAWTSNNEVSVVTGITGMDGTYCAELNADDAACRLTKALSPSLPELWLSCKFERLNTGAGNDGTLIAFLNGSTVLAILGTGTDIDTNDSEFKLWAYKGMYDALLGHNTAILNKGQVYQLAIHYKPDGASGVLQVKLDGTLVIDISGVATAPSTEDVNAVNIGDSGEGDSAWLYVDSVDIDNATWPSPPPPPPTGTNVEDTTPVGGMILGGNEIVGRYLVNSFGAETGGLTLGGTETVGVVMPLSPPVLSVTDVGGQILGGSEAVGVLIPGQKELMPGVLVPTAPAIPGELPVPEWLADLVGLPTLAGGVLLISGDEPVNILMPQVLTVVETGGLATGAPIDVSLLPTAPVVPLSPIRPEAIDAFLGPGGLILGGDEVVTWSSPPPIFAVPLPGAGEAASLRLGGYQPVVFIDPQILEIIEEGGQILGGEPEDPGIFDTYALTGSRDEPSIYSGFNFNSYARYHGKNYGAGPAGISLLEGEDDAGEKIHSGVRIPPFNVGTDREKRVRIVRCGGDTEGAQVKVSSNGHANYAKVIEGVASVDSDVQGKDLIVEISDFKEINHIEIVPTILNKRG